MDNLLTFIGLMRRAGAVECGAEASYDACRLKHARLLVLASDASENTVSAAKNAVTDTKTLVLTMPHTKAELGAALGRAECAVFAVCNTGFARSLSEKLQSTEVQEAMQQRLDREKRRKQKKLDRKEADRAAVSAAAKQAAKARREAQRSGKPEPEAVQHVHRSFKPGIQTPSPEQETQSPPVQEAQSLPVQRHARPAQSAAQPRAARPANGNQNRPAYGGGQNRPARPAQGGPVQRAPRPAQGGAKRPAAHGGTPAKTRFAGEKQAKRGI